MATSSQKIIFGLGIALVLFALLMDTLGLGSAGFSSGQLLILFSGLGLMVIGFLGQKTFSAYQGLGLILLNTVILLLLIEIASGFFLWLISSEPPPATPAQLTIPYYTEQEWSASYWNEFSSATKYQYAPYVVWRRPPFEGETIHVDEEHHRLTPEAECEAENAFLVFAFGGSTMWGTGAPDWGTIPAYLQIELANQLEQPVCVVNFGQSAYVSDQSLVELMLQLKNGVRPDWVIFYDGANDVYAAYQNGQAGAHQNLSQLQNIFQSGDETPSLGETLANHWRDKTYSGRLFTRYFDKDTAPDELLTYATMGKDAQILASEVAQNYLANLALVQEWSGLYGFEAYFYWQPVISVGEKTLTPNEQGILDSLDPDLVELYQATYTDIQQAKFENFVYLAGIFDDTESEIWIDLFHITPVGNEAVAKAMLETSSP